MKTKVSKIGWMLGVIIIVVSALGVRKSDPPDFSPLQKAARSFKAEPPKLNPEEKLRASFGKALFFDPALSQNGQIACASCHQPGKSFTDGLPLAVGLSPRFRNTPTVVNSFSSFWLYWDGRADSLASQALNPLEDPGEHGFTRSEMVHLVAQKYRAQYEMLFGKISEPLLSKLPLLAKPLKVVPPVSDTVIRFAMASSVNPKLIRDLGSSQSDITSEQVKTYREKLLVKNEKNVDEAVRNFEKMSFKEKAELNRVFGNIGLSLEAYEKGLVALESPFDAFLKSWVEAAHPNPQKHFVKGFGSEEFMGLQVFLGKGNCQLCHSGPHFRDNQFHNIGLPQTGERIDLGRSQGILTTKADPFNCNGVFKREKDRGFSESCKDLDFLNTETPEAIGAFKTPTLRNVAETAPYMHDGRFETLQQVLDHYNRMDTHSGVGFREETLRPLNLSPVEIAALKAFLVSLSSPVRDLSH